MFASKNLKMSKEKFKNQIEEIAGIGSNKQGYFDIDTNEQLKSDSCNYIKSNGEKFEVSDDDYGTKKHFAIRFDKPNGEYAYIDAYWADGELDCVQAFTTHDGLAATVSLCPRCVTYTINGELEGKNIRRHLSVYDDNFSMIEGAGRHGLISNTLSLENGAISISRCNRKPESIILVSNKEKAKKYGHQLLTHGRSIETRDKAIEHVRATFPRFKSFIDNHFSTCIENIVEIDGKLVAERDSMDWFDSLIEDTINPTCNFPEPPKLLEKKAKNEKKDKTSES